MRVKDCEFQHLWFLSHPPQSGMFNGSDSLLSVGVSDPYAKFELFQEHGSYRG